MPFIHIRLSGVDLTAAALESLCRRTRDLMVDLLGKNGGLTSVLVEPVATGAYWTVGSEAPPVAAHLEASITTGTNTAAEKADFIAAAAGMLREACGAGLAVATYVVVREIDGAAWGYDGLSQAARAAVNTAAAPQ